MKQVIIARKDLHMSAGKLAAQVSHGSMAFLSTLVKDSAEKNNRFIPPLYIVHFALDAATFEDWLSGSFTKVVLQVKSREKFFSIVEAAREKGMVEGKDFFIIRDNCLTELTPEDEDPSSPTGGRTPTVIGFRPMENEEIDPITKKLQLWRD